MMKKIQLLLAVFLCAFGLYAEDGVEFSGDIQTIWGASAPWLENENARGKMLLGSTSLTGKLDAYYDNSSAYAEGSVEYDADANKFNFSLNEIWLDYTSSFWGIRLGRQKTAWGKADGVDITNVICPTDMSSFAAMISDDSKLAVDAVRLSLSGNSFTADAYWIPFFTPNSLPLEEGNMLHKYVIPSNLSIPVTIGAMTKPELAVWNGEYGLKLSGYFTLMDVSLYGYYGWDDTPILNYSMTSLNIYVTGEYKRMAMIGGDAAIPIGPTVLRLEAAFFPMRHFQKASLSGGNSVERNELSALAGIDWMPTGWTITAQYFMDYVFEDVEVLERAKAYEHGATLSISKTLLNETLELSASGLINFNDLDCLISPSVNYSLSDQISLSAGAYIFIPGPERAGKYGKYKDLSTLYIKGKFSF